MKRISISFIIHTFALLHAAVALSCRFAGIEDELFLTILTMAMVLLICLKRKINIEFSAASIIVANIIGFLLGNLGAEILDNFIHSQYAVNALSTLATTEVLGWSIFAFTKIFRQENISENKETNEDYIMWVLAAVAGVFILRIGLILLFTHELFNTIAMTNAIVKVFSNSLALITIFCVNIIYIRYSDSLTRRMTRPLKVLTLITFMLVVSLLETVLISGVTSDNIGFWEDFPILYLTSLLAQITVYCIVFMVNYALTTRVKMQVERGKANMAQYRYMKLKQQVNPHFLFNSLNVLDCLVCEEKSEEASMYIHKLAGIYRYMIKSEEEDIVPLRDELVFMNLYLDLLHIRFPEGLKVEQDIPEDLMTRYVLPCALQLLIENATKHNVVNGDNPLLIKIEAGIDSVKVSNNIVPKVGKVESTGLGLKYLKQQYMDISGKSIVIEHTEQTFSVTLPLI